MSTTPTTEMYYGTYRVKDAYIGNNLIFSIYDPDTMLKMDYTNKGSDYLEVVGGTITQELVESDEGSCKTAVAITIPPNATTLGEYALYNCDSITSLVVPATVEQTLPNSITDLSKVETVSIAASTIQHNTCNGCPKMHTLVLEEGVQRIDYSAFGFNYALTSFNLPASVTSISVCILAYGQALTTLTVSPDNPVYEDRGCNAIIRKSDKMLMQGCTTTKIPDDTSGLYAYCFSGIGLTTIIIPNSVNNIAVNSLLNNNNMSTIYCGFSEGSVTGAPWGASNSTVVHYDANLNLTYIDDSTKLVTVGGTVTSSDVPDVDNVVAVLIPPSVTQIGTSSDEPFRGKKNLKTATVAAAYIREHSFFNATGLEDVTLQEGVQIIRSYSFYNCKLTSFHLPSTVSGFNPSAISVNKISSLTVDTANSVFEDRGANAVIRRSNNELVAGCRTTVIPESVTSIGTYAFLQSGITSVVIPESVTQIAATAFSQNPLTDIYCGFAEGAVSNAPWGADNSTVVYYSAVTDLTYADGSIKFVGAAGKLTQEQVRAAGDHTQITDVILADSITTIGDHAFQYCSSLTSITIPDTVTALEIAAFQWSGLQSIGLPDTLTSIPSYLFYGTNITTLTIPDSVISIGAYIVTTCNHLQDVTIGSGVTGIHTAAFSNTSALTDIYCRFTEGAVADAPWGAAATVRVHYLENVRVFSSTWTETTFDSSVTVNGMAYDLEWGVTAFNSFTNAKAAATTANDHIVAYGGTFATGNTPLGGGKLSFIDATVTGSLYLGAQTGDVPYIKGTVINSVTSGVAGGGKPGATSTTAGKTELIFTGSTTDAMIGGGFSPYVNDIHVLVENSTVSNSMNGGSYYNASTPADAVCGDITVELYGSSFQYRVAAGPYEQSTAAGAVITVGDIQLIADNCSFGSWVSGAGSVYGVSTGTSTTKITTGAINLQLGNNTMMTPVTDALYYGVYSAVALHSATVETGSVTIAVTDGAYDRIYCGAYADTGGIVRQGDTTCTVTGGTINSLFAGGFCTINTGYADCNNQVTGNVIIDLNGGTAVNVYGNPRKSGGQAAITGNVTVNVNAATTITKLFGAYGPKAELDVVGGSRTLNVYVPTTVESVGGFDVINIASGASLNMDTMYLLCGQTVKLETFDFTKQAIYIYAESMAVGDTAKLVELPLGDMEAPFVGWGNNITCEIDGVGAFTSYDAPLDTYFDGSSCYRLYIETTSATDDKAWLVLKYAYEFTPVAAYTLTTEEDDGTGPVFEPMKPPATSFE